MTIYRTFHRRRPDEPWHIVIQAKGPLAEEDCRLGLLSLSRLRQFQRGSFVTLPYPLVPDARAKVP